MLEYISKKQSSSYKLIFGGWIILKFTFWLKNQMKHRFNAFTAENTSEIHVPWYDVSFFQIFHDLNPINRSPPNETLYFLRNGQFPHLLIKINIPLTSRLPSPTLRTSFVTTNLTAKVHDLMNCKSIMILRIDNLYRLRDNLYRLYIRVFGIFHPKC